MSTKPSSVPEIKPQTQDERLKQRELTDAICEIKSNTNNIDVLLAQAEKESEDLNSEMVELTTKYNAAIAKENLLGDEVKNLKNVYNTGQLNLNAKYERLFNDINEFIEKDDKFLTNAGNSKMNGVDVDVQENRDEELREKELEGKNSFLELYLSVQERILKNLE